MKILVVGGGGREHAIIKKLSESPRVDKLYAAPGNAGIAQLAQCLPVSATDLKGVLAAAKEHAVDLVFVAPDDPLSLGMVDYLEENGIAAFGPRKNAAVIESSKIFSKNLMKKYGIPTAGYEVFDNAGAALAYIREKNSYPTVIKADGLALGKGVIIAADYAQAEAAVRSLMLDRVFGDAGGRVVIEEFLTGREISVLVFTDGEHIVPMVSAQDHKRVFDGDKGPNTGGMGAFSPSRVYTGEVAMYCEKNIFIPTVKAMAAEGRPFSGVLYFGLILTDNGVKVIEYNARFGDPETQAVLPRLKTDLVDIMAAVRAKTLDRMKIEWSDDAAACVVMASGGYPGKYNKGIPIKGIEKANALPDTYVYHAGTATDGNGGFLTAGGRVLGVTATGKTLDEAIAKAYAGVALISFEGAQHRSDIGRK